ncbi:MAG: fumarylacetoacetase [Lysobacteraceae bacterium]|nr:MAG: fumarylacetoacetase [Xanthomonadaceae bacterium]
MIEANDSRLVSWVEVPADSDFPIQNLPFGIIEPDGAEPRPAVAIGDHALDLAVLAEAGLLDEVGIERTAYHAPVLNPLMQGGKAAIRALRKRLSELLRADNDVLRDDSSLRDRALHHCSAVKMRLPIEIGDYTDFYSSIEHATNVGTMFRDPNNALLPNWRHLPVGYHGRSSSIILSGQPIHRPKGQMMPDGADAPVFGPCKLLDIELEMAFVTLPGKPLGDSISVAEAEDYIFGLALFNDWSARDIQKWEYVPLGPFLAKNFASSLSPWIVTLDALEPFRVAGPKQEPAVLDYLQFDGERNFDIELEVSIDPDGEHDTVVSRSNFRYMYWNMAQQLAHHTVNGCNVRAGDMMASGTISGPTPDSYGSLLEITWKGTKPLTLGNGEQRKFLADGDTVTLRGHCSKDGIRIGFGEVTTKILPAK